jgi:hypothetical protein
VDCADCKVPLENLNHYAITITGKQSSNLSLPFRIHRLNSTMSLFFCYVKLLIVHRGHVCFRHMAVVSACPCRMSHIPSYTPISKTPTPCRALRIICPGKSILEAQQLLCRLCFLLGRLHLLLSITSCSIGHLLVTVTTAVVGTVVLLSDI